VNTCIFCVFNSVLDTVSQSRSEGAPKMSIAGAIASVAGGLISSSRARKENNKQYDLARNSIKYRVEDAKNAGVHPLYALSAPTMSSSVQTDQMGQAVADAGSEIGQAETTAYERELQNLNLENAKADLMGKKLRNADFVKQSLQNSHLAKINSALKANQDAKDTLSLGKGVTLKKRLSPASEVEDYLGETGIPYSIWNTIDHLMEDAPKAMETLELIGKRKSQEYTTPVRKWWNKFKSRRGWNR